jgi:hypothetical protein
MQLGFREQLKTGTHRALGIVLAGRFDAERSVQAIASESQHPAAVALDARGEASQRALHDRENVLGVEMLAQPGRVDHIGKQHRDLLELLLGGLRMRTERRELLLE